MRSTIQVYNTALGRLGGNQLGRVNSPDEDGIVADLCRTYFGHILELSLAAHAWSFALRRVALAKKPEAGAPEYPLRYGLPADCLAPIRLEGGDPYLLEGGDLLTGAALAVLLYTARADDPATWPPAFADAVTWGLAAELATPLINDPRRQQAYLQQYDVALGKAMADDMNAQQAARPAPPWLAARE